MSGGIIRNNNDSNLSCWKYGRLRDFKNNRGIVVEALLGIIMTVILAVGNMDAYEISKIIGG